MKRSVFEESKENIYSFIDTYERVLPIESGANILLFTDTVIAIIDALGFDRADEIDLAIAGILRAVRARNDVTVEQIGGVVEALERISENIKNYTPRSTRAYRA